MDELLTRGSPPKQGEAPAAEPSPEELESHPGGRRPGRRKLRWLMVFLGGCAILGVLALFAWSLLKSSNGRNLVSAIAAGERPAAPEFRLTIFWSPQGATAGAREAINSGATLDLSRLRGHPVLINFWASWCIPCRQEAPILAAAAADHPKVVFIGVDVQDLRGDALGFLRRYRVPYPAVWDKTNSTDEAYGLTGVPETYYVDQGGRIVAHTPGPVTFQTLDVALNRIDRP